jgi:hypothetical protein
MGARFKANACSIRFSSNWIQEGRRPPDELAVQIGGPSGRTGWPIQEDVSGTSLKL